MKNIYYLAAIFLICFDTYAQPTDFLKRKKEVNIFFSTYAITIPRQMKVKETVGTDYHNECHIRFKNKKFINRLQIWIYTGYFSKNLDSNSNLKLIDSVKIKILEDDIKFRIYKKDDIYMTEGFKIIDPNEIISSDSIKNNLQIRILGQGEGLGNLENLMKILKSLNLKDQEIIVD